MSWQKELSEFTPESRYIVYEWEDEIFRVKMKKDGTFEHQKQIQRYEWSTPTHYKTLNKLMEGEGWWRRPVPGKDDEIEALRDQVVDLQKRLAKLETSVGVSTHDETSSESTS